MAAFAEMAGLADVDSSLGIDRVVEFQMQMAREKGGTKPTPLPSIFPIYASSSPDGARAGQLTADNQSLFYSTFIFQQRGQELQIVRRQLRKKWQKHQWALCAPRYGFPSASIGGYGSIRPAFVSPMASSDARRGGDLLLISRLASGAKTRVGILLLQSLYIPLHLYNTMSAASSPAPDARMCESQKIYEQVNLVVLPVVLLIVLPVVLAVLC
ncbi:hypothetical protein GQ44DRAFT_765638 [Phaeosphaeriaceae sp. PMI808]|nr:hypothetical protein GQ44DRAFT_765638 [Phaeosphaeriaceae sp. PMI808]